jgi:thymidylate synthase (FAD)
MKTCSVRRRARNPHLNTIHYINIMNHELPDGIGRIDLIGVFGSDSQIANIARMSKGKFDIDDANSNPDKDRKTISYLIKNDHKSPLYHAMLQFRIKMPLFLRAQWFRHTVGMTRVEKSRRYTNEVPEFYMPVDLKSDAAENGEDAAPSVCAILQESLDAAAFAYDNLLKRGVPAEHARIVLPVATYTEFVETGSLYAYLNLLKLRGAANAQHDLHEYTGFVAHVIRETFPMVGELAANAASLPHTP